MEVICPKTELVPISDVDCIYLINFKVLNKFTCSFLQGLGKLGEKFPLFAKQSVDCLREFLTNPSKILTRLHRHYQQEKEKSPPQLLVTQSDRFENLILQFFISAKPKIIFLFLPNRTKVKRDHKYFLFLGPT